MNGDIPELPQFLRISAADRAEAWKRNPPRGWLSELERKPMNWTREEIDASQNHPAPLSKAEMQEAHRARVARRRDGKGPEQSPLAAETFPRPLETGRGQPSDDLGARVSDIAAQGSLREFAARNGVWDDKYASLNNGLQRMNVVNRLRGKMKKDPSFKVQW